MKIPKIKVVYLCGELGECIVIDTEELTEQALENKYHLQVVDSFEVSHGDLLFWPTDQALQPNKV